MGNLEKKEFINGINSADMETVKIIKKLLSADDKMQKSIAELIKNKTAAEKKEILIKIFC